MLPILPNMYQKKYSLKLKSNSLNFGVIIFWQQLSKYLNRDAKYVTTWLLLSSTIDSGVILGTEYPSCVSPHISLYLLCSTIIHYCQNCHDSASHLPLSSIFLKTWLWSPGSGKAVELVPLMRAGCPPLKSWSHFGELVPLWRVGPTTAVKWMLRCQKLCCRPMH